MLKVDWKQFGKKVALFFIISVTMVFLFTYFNIPFIGKYLILISINTIFLLVLKQFKVKTLITNAIFILIFMLMYRSLGLVAGIIGWFLADVLLGIAIIILRFKSFLKLKRDTEETLWGKSLKEYHKSGEKPPKIIINWKGKK